MCKGCTSCPYGPGNFEEFAIAQNNPTAYCPDAFSEKAKHCGIYDQSRDSEEKDSE